MNFIIQKKINRKLGMVLYKIKKKNLYNYKHEVKKNQVVDPFDKKLGMIMYKTPKRFEIG